MYDIYDGSQTDPDCGLTIQPVGVRLASVISGHGGLSAEGSFVSCGGSSKTSYSDPARFSFSQLCDERDEWLTWKFIGSGLQ